MYTITTYNNGNYLAKLPRGAENFDHQEYVEIHNLPNSKEMNFIDNKFYSLSDNTIFTAENSERIDFQPFYTSEIGDILYWGYDHINQRFYLLIQTGDKGNVNLIRLNKNGSLDAEIYVPKYSTEIEIL